MTGDECPFGCLEQTAICVSCAAEHSWCVTPRDLADLAESGWDDGERIPPIDGWRCSDCLDAAAEEARRGGQMAMAI